MENLKKSEECDIWLIGGGKLISSFLNDGLIDKIILSIIPTVIGSGIRLFPDNPNESSWNLTKAAKFDTGVVNLTYEKR